MVTERASERRSSVRRPIQLEASLEIGSASWPCEITDFCAEGLFLRYSDAVTLQIQPAFAAAPPAVSVRFLDPVSRQEHRFQARPVRRIDGAMGVEFTASNPGAVEALLGQCLIGQDEFRPLPSGPGRGSFVLRQCTRATAQFVEPLVQEWFDTVERQLQDSAQQVSDQHARELMDASVALKTQRRSFWQTMNRVIESPQKRAEKNSQGESQLDLVDKGEFEDWLLLRVMVTKAETQFRGPLLQLKMRLDKAEAGLDSGHQNPLGPILVCDAFRQALENLGFPRAVDKVAFRIFEQEVVRHLEPLYSALNQIFIRHGILPDLDLSKYLSNRAPEKSRLAPEKPEASAGHPAETVAEPGREKAGSPARDIKAEGRSRRRRNNRTAEGATSAQSSIGKTATAFSMVGRLLASLKGSRGQGKAGADVFTDARPVPLATDELQHELAAMAAAPQTPAGGNSQDTLSLRARVEARLGALEQRQLAPEQDATLDVVDQFFVSLEQSPRLSAASRGYLHQLGIPVLQAVLRDRAAFEDEDNPVRGVLNRIAQLGPRGGRPNLVLQRRVEAVVERINNGFANDPAVFAAALTELDELAARQDLAYQRNVERVTAAAEGAQKVEEARAAVTEALTRRLGSQRVPRAVATLLNEGWRDLLTLTHVRQGPGSSAWQSYLAVIDTLMAFASDPTIEVELRQLLQVIQDGLSSISSSQKPTVQIREELKQFLGGNPSPASELVDVPVAQATPEKAGEGDRRRKRLRRWIKRARELKLGDWMRYQEDPDNPSYMRLVWLGRDGARFVFVNHQGMKLVEFDLLKMADHLQKGVVVSDPDFERPIVDDSIDRMVQQLYEEATRASTRDELTGLLTRREFERCLGEWLATAAGDGGDGPAAQKALVVLELQYLRELTDTAGFECGDQALRRVTELLSSRVPGDAHLARLGGPRFGFLLPAGEVEQKTTDMIAAIKALPLQFSGHEYRLSANAGIAVDQPGLASAEVWLASVEDGLVRCRKDGREAVLWYAPEHDETGHIARPAKKFSGIDDLARERILLRSQKILPLHGETRLGVQHQILYSLYDEAGQLIHGSDIVRVGPRHSRIPPVDRWLVSHLLDWMSAHPKALQDLGGVGVSLTADAFTDEALLEAIFERMSQHDLPVEQLWFEVSEAVARANLESAAAFMNEVSELGCQFCLSHFYGRSESYDLVKRLPVARVKVDSSFLVELLQDRNDQAMVRSMIDMTHYLGREIIAGHVEDRAAVDLLVDMGMDYAQGGAIERPRSFDG